MLRNTLAVLAGGLTNVLVVTTAEWLTMRTFPLPPGLDFSDSVQLEAALRAGPPLAFVGVLLGILLASLLSGMVAARIATNPRRVVLVVGIFLVVANVLNAFSFWHPLWFRVLAVLLPFPLAWLGGRLGARRAAEG